jgi:hypothetical protein
VFVWPFDPTFETVILEELDARTATLSIGVKKPASVHFTCVGGTPNCEAIPPSKKEGTNAGSATGAQGAIITANNVTIDIVSIDAHTVSLKINNLKMPG